MDKNIEKCAKYSIMMLIAVTAIVNLNQFAGVSKVELVKDVVDETAKRA